VVSDDSGGVYAEWIDTRGSNPSLPYYDVLQAYCQHITRFGGVGLGFTTDGIRVAATTEIQGGPSLARDTHGGVVAAWTQGDPQSKRLYAQRLDSQGAAHWLPFAAVVDSTPYGPTGEVHAVPDDVGGTVFVWEDTRTAFTSGQVFLYAQRLDSLGQRQWQTGGVPVATASPVMQSAVTSDGLGGALIAWADARYETSDVFVQRVDRSGTPLWAVNGVSPHAGHANVRAPRILADGSGGAYVMFQGVIYQHTFVNHILSNGELDPAWPPSGIDPGVHHPGLIATVVLARGGDVMAAWRTNGAGGDSLFVQRITPAGELALGQDGVLVLSNQVYGPNFARDFAVADFSGGIAFPLVDTGTYLYSWLRLDANGSPVPGYGIESAPFFQSNDAGQLAPGGVIPDDGGGAIIVWMPGQYSVVAQYVRPDGSLGGDVVPVNASLISAEASADGVRLSWFAPSTTAREFILERAVPNGPWVQIASLTPSGTDVTEFTDHDILPGSRYGYRLAWDGTGGRIQSTPVWIEVPDHPLLALKAPVPNPSSGGALMRFSLPTSTAVDLRFYDVAGRLVREIAAGELVPGEHALAWDGRAASGERLVPGIYLLRLHCALGNRETKLVIAR
jgi:hypothetical protein